MLALLLNVLAATELSAVIRFNPGTNDILGGTSGPRQ
jgi:hypothetical protein